MRDLGKKLQTIDDPANRRLLDFAEGIADGSRER
jgi:hypothetical protein